MIYLLDSFKKKIAAAAAAAATMDKSYLSASFKITATVHSLSSLYARNKDNLRLVNLVDDVSEVVKALGHFSSGVGQRLVLGDGCFTVSVGARSSVPELNF